MATSHIAQIRPALTAERLRELLHYDQVTDKWTRRSGPNAGEIAESPDYRGRQRIIVDGTQYLSARLRWLYLNGEWPSGQLRHASLRLAKPTDRNCVSCGETKPISEFPSAKTCKSGYRSQCKACRAEAIRQWKADTGWKPKPEAVKKKKENRIPTTPKQNRNANLSLKYKISLADYDRLFEKQGGACALCRVPGRLNQWGNLSVDHCHDTGKIRGLLCIGCNAALGALGDTPACLQRALDYVSEKLPVLDLQDQSANPIYLKKFVRA